MAKKRKTRQEKKLADQRQHHVAFAPETAAVTPSMQVATSPYTFSINSPLPRRDTTTNTAPKTSLLTYQYAIGDLRKTFFITLAIIVGQIVLFFILKR